jgi:hypothetical protein
MVNISRRCALQGSLLPPLMAGASLAADTGALAAGSSVRVLVAYFTRTSNTRLIATQISRALGATLFQIVPAEAYPEDYKAQVAQAESERERGYEPPLQATVADVGTYKTVYLGFPV